MFIQAKDYKVSFSIYNESDSLQSDCFIMDVLRSVPVEELRIEVLYMFLPQVIEIMEVYKEKEPEFVQHIEYLKNCEGAERSENQ